MTVEDTPSYDVRAESKQAFLELVDDPRLAIPAAVKKFASNVVYEGSPMPWLCVPYKFTEAISAVKGIEAIFVSAIAKHRYGKDAGSLTIDTDHATLFILSAFITTINGQGAMGVVRNSKAVRDADIYDSFKNTFRQQCTNVYKTKDGRYFHLHGSLNARISQGMVGIDPENKAYLALTEREQIVPIFADAVAQWNAEDIDREANDKYKQAGTICYSHEEFKQIEAGKAIADCPIYELRQAAPSSPVSWPLAPASAPLKALTGIKVLELTRIIAGPAIGRGLAEHGATVLRITSNTTPDLHTVHPDLNQGKFCADLNLKTEAGKRVLRELVKDADVFIDGYRPGALGRLGFSADELRKINPDIVFVRENCYGWHGPWVGRSGWQQISDCFTGVSEGFGRALGLPEGEAVVPIFPNSDYGCGASGLVGVLHALYARATVGGVYNVDLSLSYYNLHVLKLGQYPTAIWDQIRPAAPLRHDWEMSTMLPVILPEIFKRRPDVFQNPKFWYELDSKSFGGVIRTPAPVVKPQNGFVIGIERAAVQNGDDAAEWPPS